MRFVFIVVVFFAARSRAKEWDYDDFTKWPGVSALCANEESQSPILLSPKLAEKADECVVLEWENAKPQDFIVNNNGYSVYYTPILPAGESVANSFEFNGKRWCLDGFHLHWSQNISGSEHRFVGKDNPMEMHFVHWDCDDYDSLADAIDEATNVVQTVAVFGVLFQLGEGGIADSIINADVFSEGLQTTSETSEIHNLDYTKFLPELPDRQFYLYNGSLTTPTCDPVMWIVFTYQPFISSAELDILRTVQNLKGTILQSNQRPIQGNSQPLFLYDVCKEDDDGRSPPNRGAWKVRRRRRKANRRKDKKNSKKTNKGKQEKKSGKSKNQSKKSKKRSKKNSKKNAVNDKKAPKRATRDPKTNGGY